ncbi:hypothetical protein AXF42_Ash005283 [Apostasia shenzhenica]|uniref:Uncharacterized protein n=1 Tax=Apostasia shenzhenica TaxID=1088818 RepID=A0A2I0B6G3_9ASPA|nr:hypothetical protein AXF42_Ash005283 [Apostasia shenzhenica]
MGPERWRRRRRCRRALVMRSAVRCRAAGGYWSVMAPVPEEGELEAMDSMGSLAARMEMTGDGRSLWPKLDALSGGGGRGRENRDFTLWQITDSRVLPRDRSPECSSPFSRPLPSSSSSLPKYSLDPADSATSLDLLLPRRSSSHTSSRSPSSPPPEAAPDASSRSAGTSSRRSCDGEELPRAFHDPLPS